MTDKHLPQSPTGEFIMFASSDGRVRVECRFESDTIWLSQAAIAELYDKDVRTINEHLINIKYYVSPFHGHYYGYPEIYSRISASAAFFIKRALAAPTLYIFSIKEFSLAS